MKKIWHTLKYKAYMRRKARRSHQRQLLFKDRKRRERQSELGVSLRRRKMLRTLKHQRIAYKYIVAPDTLSFADNAGGVSKFIRQLEKRFQRRQSVFIVLSDTHTVEYDAVAVLLSVMVRFKSHRIHFNGNFPQNPTARRVIEQSRFFEHLDQKYGTTSSYELTGKDAIFTHGNLRVDSELGSKIIERASETVWGEKRRCTKVQGTLIEMMGNTKNHATPEGGDEKHWWLTVTHEPEYNQVKFSFVDYGVGVFGSLHQKTPGDWLYAPFQTVWKRLRNSGHPAILQQIFCGTLHKTVTGEDYRGKGLPYIHSAFEAGNFTDFVMITNDVVYDSRHDAYRTLSPPFSGTFACWTVNVESRSLPHAD